MAWWATTRRDSPNPTLLPVWTGRQDVERNRGKERENNEKERENKEKERENIEKERESDSDTRSEQKLTQILTQNNGLNFTQQNLN